MVPISLVSVLCPELTTAVQAAEVSSLMRFHLGDYVGRIFFQTDCMIVLYYIWNLKSRFATFLANRLAMIRDLTSTCQWRRVRYEDNLTDLKSHGCFITPQKFVNDLIG